MLTTDPWNWGITYRASNSKLWSIFSLGAQSIVCTKNPPKPPLCSASRLMPSIQSSGVPTIHAPRSTMLSTTPSKGPSYATFRPLVPSEYSLR